MNTTFKHIGGEIIVWAAFQNYCLSVVRSENSTNDKHSIKFLHHFHFYIFIQEYTFSSAKICFAIDPV